MTEHSSVHKKETATNAKPTARPRSRSALIPLRHRLRKEFIALLPISVYRALAVHILSAVPAAAVFRGSMYLIGLIFAEEPWHTYFHTVDVVGLLLFSVWLLINFFMEIIKGKDGSRW
jgi:hypothetical protein